MKYKFRNFKKPRDIETEIKTCRYARISLLLFPSWMILLDIRVKCPILPFLGGDLPLAKIVGVNESAASVKFFSASSIFPTRSHSWRRCCTRGPFLLSKHDTIMFSMWWCKKLLYGYLEHSKWKWRIRPLLSVPYLLKKINSVPT